MNWLRDVSPADWLVEQTLPYAGDVGSLVPAGYDAYARVLHPRVTADGRKERWSEIARRNGRVAHAAMQYGFISRRPGETEPAEPGERHPREGSLPPDERRVLVDLTPRGRALEAEVRSIADKIKTACQLTDQGLDDLRRTLEALAHPASE